MNEGFQALFGEVAKNGGGDGEGQQIIIKVACQPFRALFKPVTVAVDEGKIGAVEAEKVGDGRSIVHGRS